MYVAMIIVFVLGYICIAFEHSFRIDKAASALVTGVLCWTIYILGANQIIDFSTISDPVLQLITGGSHETLNESQIIHEYVGHHLIFENIAEIASILFFLLGAMTIVELIDAHEGFRVITDAIKTTSKVRLVWTIGLITFFLSATLDNLTTSIVMISLLRKLVDDQKTRWMLAGLVIITANSGGAWSPIGDVTTTMLWIGNQITTVEIIKWVILPSLICTLIPMIILSLTAKGHVKRPADVQEDDHRIEPTSKSERNTVFIAGIAGLLFVPVFKSVTELPPFMGMMLSLGALWILTDLMHRRKNLEYRARHSVIGVLRKIDTASVLFFLGILLAVGSLQGAGQLGDLAHLLDEKVGTETQTGVYGVGILIGALSAIVDNVPLVAAAMGMYPLAPDGFFAVDGLFWEFLAYCAGTGGSMLIIGSAAGVAVMGLEKITFGWYLRKMSLLAMAGYLGGAIAYIIQHALIR